MARLSRECSYKLRSNWTAAAADAAAPMPRHRRSPSSLPTKEAKTSSMEGRKGNGRGLRSADSEADADDGRVKSGAAHSGGGGGGGGSNSVAVVGGGRTDCGCRRRAVLLPPRRRGRPGTGGPVFERDYTAFRARVWVPGALRARSSDSGAGH